MKYLDINLKKYAQDLHKENYKSLMSFLKETKACHTKIILLRAVHFIHTKIY